MTQGKEYYAFISYKREDEKWANWLQHMLEHYKFPTNLNKRTDLPKNIRPTFRDVTDLTPEPLEQAINNALRNSEWLIVVCSPRSAKSPWVCKEAQTFVDLGRADHIIPFVIEGTPFSKDATTECYPEALLNLTGSRELLAANINEMGRDAAAIKVVARMFNLRFDTLWQRHEKEKRRKRNWIIAGITAFTFIVLGMAGMAEQQRVRAEQQRDRAEQAEDSIRRQNQLIEQQRIRAEQAEDSIRGQNQLIKAQQDSILLANRSLTEERNRLIAANNELLFRESNIMAGEAERIMDDNAYLAQRLALAALPSDLEHPDRPYVPAAERALRLSSYRQNGIIGPDTTCYHSEIQVLPRYFYLQRYRDRLAPDTTEYVFQAIDSTIFQVDLQNGTRRPVLKTPTHIVNFKASYGSYGPRITILQDNQTFSFWEHDDDGWIQYDTLDLTICGISFISDFFFSSDKFGDKVVCAGPNHRDSTFIFRKPDDQWVVTDRLTGGLCDISGSRLATYSKTNKKIYLWGTEAYRSWYHPYAFTFVPRDTLDTDADNIYTLSYSDGLLVASGDKGIHTYQYRYEHGQSCWEWTDLIKAPTCSKAAIKSSREFYIPTETNLWHFKKEDSFSAWEYTRMDNIRKPDWLGEMQVKLVDTAKSLLVYEASMDRLQYINLAQSPTQSHRPLFSGRGSNLLLYYQDGNDMLCARYYRSNRNFSIGITREFSNKSHRWIDTLYGHTNTIHNVQYCNGYLLSTSKDSTLRVWERHHGKYQCVDSIHNAVFTDFGYADISKDGSVVSYSYGTASNNIFVKSEANKWILADSIPQPHPFTWIRNNISKHNAIAYRHYDTNLMSPYVALYYPRYNKKKKLCPLHHAEDIKISPAGNAIVGVPWWRPKEISLYIIENDSVVDTKTLRGHSDNIRTVNFSTNGKYMVSTAQDNTIRVWHIPSGECLEVITSDAGSPQEAYFTEDCAHIIVKNHSIKSGWSTDIYDFPSLQQLIDRSRERYKDTPITPEDRRKYNMTLPSSHQ